MEANRTPISELGKQVKLYAAAGTLLLSSLFVWNTFGGFEIKNNLMQDIMESF